MRQGRRRIVDRATKRTLSLLTCTALALAALAVPVLLIWHGPAQALGPTAAVLDIGVLVFREGLECILVLAAITAGTAGAGATSWQPISAGVAAGCVCTLITWRVAVSLVEDLSTKISALTLQAVTGLIAVLVLLLVMNWFFHKVYWAGWISMHTRKRQTLLREANQGKQRRRSLWLGFALLGFTSFYREGFEIVLFLQSYRMRLGGLPVACGVLMGVLLSGMVAIATFVAHRRLPYRRMLVLTGILIGGVLLVLVGEPAQEMQLARWLPTTNIPVLARIVPPWSGVWFSVFPTVETLAAQLIAAMLILGSYFIARSEARREAR